MPSSKELLACSRELSQLVQLSTEREQVRQERSQDRQVWLMMIMAGWGQLDTQLPLKRISEERTHPLQKDTSPEHVEHEAWQSRQELVTGSGTLISLGQASMQEPSYRNSAPTQDAHTDEDEHVEHGDRQT